MARLFSATVRGEKKKSVKEREAFSISLFPSTTAAPRSLYIYSLSEKQTQAKGGRVQTDFMRSFIFLAIIFSSVKRSFHSPPPRIYIYFHPPARVTGSTRLIFLCSCWYIYMYIYTHSNEASELVAGMWPGQ